jgi:hypothetical protein
MLLWQLAAPTLVAVFLALVTIRGSVESSDAFARFWDRVMAGRTAITILVDAQTDGSISPAMADAALPIERLSETLQVPVHLAAAGANVRTDSYLIRLSLKERPDGGRSFRVGPATLVHEGTRDGAMWLWAENAEDLRAAARTLTSRLGFPEIQ